MIELIKARVFIIALLLAVLSADPDARAAEAETETLLRRKMPPIEMLQKTPEEKDRAYFDSFFETSNVLQGVRTGRWSEFTNTYGYIHKSIQGYFSVSRFGRFDDYDYTANIGSYFNFKNSYFHGEIAFGWDVSYIYRCQTIAEYAHKLYKGFYWQAGYTWRDYPHADTHIIYPGLAYYFGDSYMSVDFCVSPIERRDTAKLCNLKGSFAITDFLRLIGGFTIGERIYDIYGLKASKEFGYSAFGAVNITFLKDINFRIGYSYGTEEPKFIKRSLNFGLNIKF